MSKIDVHPSLVVARKIVLAIEKILPKDIAKTLTLKSWSNGREQGLCLRSHAVGVLDTASAIVFAEARSSDSIIIVHGNAFIDFDPQTNQPNEETWEKNRKYFKCGEYSKAAKYILGLLK